MGRCRPQRLGRVLAERAPVVAGESPEVGEADIGRYRRHGALAQLDACQPTARRVQRPSPDELGGRHIEFLGVRLPQPALGDTRRHAELTDRGDPPRGVGVFDATVDEVSTVDPRPVPDPPNPIGFGQRADRCPQ